MLETNHFAFCSGSMLFYANAKLIMKGEPHFTLYTAFIDFRSSLFPKQSFFGKFLKMLQ